MDTQIVYQFPGATFRKEMARAWQWHPQQDGVIALAYSSNALGNYPIYPSNLSFFLYDVKARKCLRTGSSSSSTQAIEELRLAYDLVTKTWVIGEMGESLVLREVSICEEDQVVISDPLYGEEEEQIAPLGPFLAFHASAHKCTFISYRSGIGTQGTPPGIYRTSVDLSSRQATDIYIAASKSALICDTGTTSLYLGLEQFRNHFSDHTYEWLFLLSGYEGHFQTWRWKASLTSGISTEKEDVRHRVISDFEWLGINAAAISGPVLTPDLQTFVVGATMMDIFALSGYGHTSRDSSLLPKKTDELVLIDANGQTLQTCTGSLGLRMQFCQMQSVVVGVDLLAGRWRLWGWTLLHESGLNPVKLLDESVFRAHVIGEDGQKDSFWLIEELSEGVRISRRDTLTLAEIGLAAMLKGIHLLDPQRARGALDWYASVEAFCSKGKLLLLALSQTHQLLLYEIG